MDENPKRGNETKSNSTVLFALIVVAALAVSLFLILNQQKKTLEFSDFNRLLNRTVYDESREKLISGLENDGILNITEPGTKGRVLEYTKPNKMIVSGTSVKGRVMFRVVKGQGATKSGEFEDKEFTSNKDNADSTNEALRKLLDQTNARWDFVTGPNAWDRYGFFLLTMVLIIGLFYLMMRRLGGAGGPMQFGRSRGRLMAEDDLGVMFSDVAGIDEAVDEVKELVE